MCNQLPYIVAVDCKTNFSLEGMQGPHDMWARQAGPHVWDNCTGRAKKEGKEGPHMKLSK